VVIPAVLTAPVVMGIATRVERRLGPSAGGWVAALPIGFAVATVAVLLDAGGGATSAMALSAAAHVVAQVVFAVVVAAVLVRRGRVAAVGAGVLAYVVVALAVTFIPQLLAIAFAVPALILAPRLIVAPPPRVARARHWSVTVATCLGSAVVVGGAVVTAQIAGPSVAGAIAAFPTTTTMLAVALSLRAGSPVAISVLLGLVRSLPCYLTFCLTVPLLVPAVGVFAVPLALLACLAAGCVVWRTVPLARPGIEQRRHVIRRGEHRQ
jgi:hypothetical protein